MGKSLKFLADNLIMSPNFDRRQLPLSAPEAAPLRERGITLCTICAIKDLCEVDRRDPSIHVLIFSIQGDARVFTSNSSRKGTLVSSGDVVILPSHHSHHYHMEGAAWKAMWVFLQDSQPWSMLREQGPRIRKSTVINELAAAFEGYWAESLRNESRARLAGKHYAEIMALNIERELDTGESANSKQMRQRLYALWDTVGAGLGRDWTVADLAEEIGVSPQHLYRISQRFCGHKPMEMVTRLRMQQAQELLINTDHMVKSIARLLGYADAFSFSAAFKRYYGCSPRDFRQQDNNHKPKKAQSNP